MYIYIYFIYILNAMIHKVERCYISNSNKVRQVRNKTTKSCKNYYTLFAYVLYS